MEMEPTGFEKADTAPAPPSFIRSYRLIPIILLILLPLALDAMYTFRQAPRIPFRDQLLASMRIAVKASDGELTFNDLWKQHNEHRIFFTRLITACMARFAHWNLRYQAALTLIFSALMLFGLLILLRFPTARSSIPLSISGAFFLVPLRLWAIWQNSFLNQHLFAVIFLLAALVSLQRMKRSPFSLLTAALCCFGATVSVGTGLLSWFAVGSFFVLRKDRKTSEVLSWLVLMGLGFAVYFHGFSLGGHDPLEGSLLHKTAYFLTFLGNPFVDTMSESFVGATLAGAFGLIAWIVAWYALLRRGVVNPETFLFIPLGLFALGSAFLATLSRSYIGCIQALFSHYVLYSSLLWISLFVAISRLCFDFREERCSHRIRAIVILFFILPASAYISANIRSWHSPAFVTPELETCFRRYPTTGNAECLSGLHAIFEIGSPEAHNQPAPTPENTEATPSKRQE